MINNKKKPIETKPTGDSALDACLSGGREAKKSQKVMNIISRVFVAIYIIVAATINITLTALSVLPLKYLSALIGVSLLIAIICGVLVFKKSLKKVARSIALALEVIFTAAFAVVFFYLATTMNFLDLIQAGNYQIEEYYVMVKNDSSFKNLKDLENHSVAVYKDTSENYQSALTELKSQTTVETVTYLDFIDASTAMLENENISALLLKGSLRDVVEEIVPDFTTKNTRVIYTIEIKTPIKAAETKDIDISTEPFNIYISGIDTYGEIAKVSRSDVNMIVTVNPKTHQILLTSIPRDYYVLLHGTDGPKDKLTHAGIYGVDMSRQTLEDLFGIEIDYYVRINFSSAIDLINAVDGVEVTPDTTFTARANSGCRFTAGETIHVGGDCALAYARERYAYASGDRHRAQNQQEVLAAIIEKITSSKTLISKYTDILASIGTSLQTNIPSSQIYKLVNLQLDTMPSWSIDRISVDGWGAYDITYSAGLQELYVMIPDEDTVHDAVVKINKVMGTPLETPESSEETIESNSAD